MDFLDILVILLITVVVALVLKLHSYPPSNIVIKSGGADSYSLEPVSKQNLAALKRIDPDSTHVANITDSLIQASFLKNWHGYAFVHDGVVVGFGSYADYDKVPGAVKIYKVMVDKNYQGKGYGTKFMELIIGELSGREVYIDLNSGNTGAKKLYLKWFDVVSETADTIIMRKRD